MTFVMEKFAQQVHSFPTPVMAKLVRLALQPAHPQVYEEFLRANPNLASPVAVSMRYWDMNKWTISQLLKLFLEVRDVESAYAVMDEMRQVRYVTPPFPDPI